MTANACSMVHLVCLFITTHLSALLQDNCLNLVRCAFFRKLSAYVKNITAFCQHLLRQIYRQHTNIGPIYRPGRYIGLSVNFTIVIVTNYSSWFSFTCFKLQQFACKICLTFTGVMMRWKTRNLFPCWLTVTYLLAAIFVAFNYEK